MDTVKADKEAGGAKIPEALGKRTELVKLSDGSSVVVEEWSWPKLQKLGVLVGKIEHVHTLVEQSLRAEDRPKLEKMTGDDVARVAIAVTRLNLPAVKNLLALGGLWNQAAEGLNGGSTS